MPAKPDVALVTAGQRSRVSDFLSELVSIPPEAAEVAPDAPPLEPSAPEVTPAVPTPARSPRRETTPRRAGRRRVEARDTQPRSSQSAADDSSAERRADRFAEIFASLPIPDGIAVGPWAQLSVGLPPEVADAIHRAALSRGSEREKSAIVRDVLGRFLVELDKLEADDPGRFEDRLRDIRRLANEFGGRKQLAYRIEPDQYRRLIGLNAMHRIKLDHLAAVALVEAFAPAEEGIVAI